MASSNLAKMAPVLSTIPCLLIGLHIEGAAVLLSAIAIEIATSQGSNIWAQLKEKLAPNNFLHQEIQTALSTSFNEALKELRENFLRTPAGMRMNRDEKTAVKELCTLMHNHIEKTLGSGQIALNNPGSFELFLLDQQTPPALDIARHMPNAPWLEELQHSPKEFTTIFLQEFIPLWQKYFHRLVIHNDVTFRAIHLLQSQEMRHNQHHLVERLEAFIERYMTVEAAHTAVQLQSNLPPLNETYFPHQQNLLPKITEALTPDMKVVLTGGHGVGKTLTALTVSQKLQDSENLVVLWVKADDENQIIQDYATLAVACGLAASRNGGASTHLEEQIEQFRQRAKAFVELLAKHANWLLVLDNADEWLFTLHNESPDRFRQLIRTLTPNPQKGRILITTTERPQIIEAIKGFTTIELHEMRQEFGAEFLLQRAGFAQHIPPRLNGKWEPSQNEFWHDALTISQSVNGLPLALDQAAAVIKQMSKDRFGFSLREYIRLYEEQEQESFVLTKSYQGAHAPVYTTFLLALNRLHESADLAHHEAIDLLKMMAFLSPDDIPYHLLDIALNDPEPGTAVPSRADSSTAVLAAYHLRLLDYDPGRGMVNLHRVVHNVLWEMILQEGTAVAWLQIVVQLLGNALSMATEALPTIYPHILAFNKRLDELEEKGLLPPHFWDTFAGNQQAQRVLHTINDLKVMQAIEDGARWEILLLGTDDPVYSDVAHTVSGLHNVQNPLWLRRMEQMMAAISRVCSPPRARTIFTCIYLLTHYWWDFYIPQDNLGDPLLEIWDKTHRDETDQNLVTALRAFNKAYPPERAFQEREHRRSRGHWQKAHEAVQKITAVLHADNLPNGYRSSAYRYAQAILNLYTAECRTILLPRGQEPDVEALNLLDKAYDLLQENGDSFHVVWLLRELSNTHLRLGNHYLSLIRHRPFDAHTLTARAHELYDDAVEYVREGLETAVDNAASQDDIIDLEVVSNFYRILADITWHQSADAATAAVYRTLAITLAYIWLGSEQDWDIYTLEFVHEQTERLHYWLQELSASAPAELQQAWEICTQLLTGDSPRTGAYHPGHTSDLFDALEAQLLPHLPTPADLQQPPAASFLASRTQLKEAVVNRLKMRAIPAADPFFVQAIAEIIPLCP